LDVSAGKNVDSIHALAGHIAVNADKCGYEISNPAAVQAVSITFKSLSFGGDGSPLITIASERVSYRPSNNLHEVRVDRDGRLFIVGVREIHQDVCQRALELAQDHHT
jgi:hypothetical protein